MAGYQSLIDMLNGGGAGSAGDEFQDGPLSGFLNMLGIRPMGYRDRMDASPVPPANPRITASTSGSGGYGQPTPAAAPGLGFGLEAAALPPGAGSTPLAFGANPGSTAGLSYGQPAADLPPGAGGQPLAFGDLMSMLEGKPAATATGAATPRALPGAADPLEIFRYMQMLERQAPTPTGYGPR